MIDRLRQGHPRKAGGEPRTKSNKPHRSCARHEPRAYNYDNKEKPRRELRNKRRQRKVYQQEHGFHGHADDSALFV